MQKIIKRRPGRIFIGPADGYDRAVPKNETIAGVFLDIQEIHDKTLMWPEPHF